MLVEVSQTVGLVALCSHVQHVNAHLVFRFDIGPILDQQLDQLDIAVETCVVQGIEPLISLGRSVEPIRDLLHYLLVHVV